MRPPRASLAVVRRGFLPVKYLAPGVPLHTKEPGFCSFRGESGRRSGAYDTVGGGEGEEGGWCGSGMGGNTGSELGFSTSRESLEQLSLVTGGANQQQDPRSEGA